MPSISKTKHFSHTLTVSIKVTQRIFWSFLPYWKIALLWCISPSRSILLNDDLKLWIAVFQVCELSTSLVFLLKVRIMLNRRFSSTGSVFEAYRRIVVCGWVWRLVPVLNVTTLDSIFVQNFINTSNMPFKVYYVPCRVSYCGVKYYSNCEVLVATTLLKLTRNHLEWVACCVPFVPNSNFSLDINKVGSKS